MSEFSRHFTLHVSVDLSGIDLTRKIGPLVERWNRHHDRTAALQLTQKYCNGIAVSHTESYKRAIDWTLDFLMTGPLTSDKKVAAVCALLLETFGNHPMDCRSLPAGGTVQS